MSDYCWASPGGAYVVPDSFRKQLQDEFPGYRVRWSLKKQHWMIEQTFDHPDPPFRPDPYADDQVRASEGYWQVMAFQPGDRMACPYCKATLRVPICEAAEVLCAYCKANGRDGRVMAAYWPFDERLLDELRQTNPLTWGTGKVDGKLRVLAGARADRSNDAIVKEGYRQLSDVVTSSTIETYNRQVGIAQTGWTGNSGRLVHSDRTGIN